MAYTDYYLKAADRKALDAALGNIADNPANAVDRIGQDPVRVIGEDEKGEPVTETLPGYLCNLRTAEPLADEQLEAMAGMILPTPNNPIRAWL